jgi:hypothetical protein
MIIPASHIPTGFATRKEEKQYLDTKEWKDDIDQSVELYEKAVGKTDIDGGDIRKGIYDLHNTGAGNLDRVLGSGELLRKTTGKMVKTAGELDIDPKDPHHLSFHDKEKENNINVLFSTSYTFEQKDGIKTYTSSHLGLTKSLVIDEQNNDWNISSGL